MICQCPYCYKIIPGYIPTSQHYSYIQEWVSRENANICIKCNKNPMMIKVILVRDVDQTDYTKDIRAKKYIYLYKTLFYYIIW